MGDLDSYLIHGSLSPPESSTQTASPSVQPFFAGLTNVADRQTNRQTDRQTDTPTDRRTDHDTRSVTIGRIYLRSTAMRPNKTADS